MGLEDVLNAKKKYGKASGLAQHFEKQPNDSGLIRELYDFSKITPAEQQAHLESRPYEIDSEIKQRLGTSQRELIDAVRANYEPALDELPAERLYSVLLSLKPVKTGDAKHDKIAKLHEQVQKFAEELENERTDSYFKDLKERDKNTYEAFQRKALTNPKLMLSLAQYRISELQHELQEAFAEGEGKDRKLDIDTLRAYVKNTISKYDDNAKNGAYLAIGSALEKKK